MSDKYQQFFDQEPTPTSSNNNVLTGYGSIHCTESSATPKHEFNFLEKPQDALNLSKSSNLVVDFEVGSIPELKAQAAKIGNYEPMSGKQTSLPALDFRQMAVATRQRYQRASDEVNNLLPMRKQDSLTCRNKEKGKTPESIYLSSGLYDQLTS